MSSRRNFIRDIGWAGVSLGWMSRLDNIRQGIRPGEKLDWNAVRNEFPITSWEKIQFNSGSAGVMPNAVRIYLTELIDKLNSKAPYVVWGEWQEVKKQNLDRIANLTGSTRPELQIVRNTTEALNMIIDGLHFSRGDEVIISENAYPFAMNAWEKQGGKRWDQSEKSFHQTPS